MIRKICLAATAFFALGGASHAPAPTLELGKLARIGEVDERYQGFNVEMVEVTGGRFWAPYGDPANEMFRQRAPLDLTDPRLIAIARQLAPSLVRISGSWTNHTYLEAPGERLDTSPSGFDLILKREQWKNVVAFSKAVDAPIVTSFAVSNGTRDNEGNWTTSQAQRLVDLTNASGGSIYAAEFFNEANMASSGPQMPRDYDAECYAVEFRTFRDWARKAMPRTKLLGPSAVGAGGRLTNLRGYGGFIPTEELLKPNAGSLDAFSYHFYGSLSQRCEKMGIGTAAKEDALKPEWLDSTAHDYGFYAQLRDRYEPGKPIWNTETAQAGCGGSPWASTFLDTFRYLNQLGILAQKGAKVVLHNTLATSDYALIDWDTMTPRPNYWAAVLWRRNMDKIVLASAKSPSPELRLYAHCLRGKPGGVALLAINTGATAHVLRLGGKAHAWTMTGVPLDTLEVRVNDRLPRLTQSGETAGLAPTKVRNELRVIGKSIAFAAAGDAANPACK